jgi:hypothetical protein
MTAIYKLPHLPLSVTIKAMSIIAVWAQMVLPDIGDKITLSKDARGVVRLLGENQKAQQRQRNKLHIEEPIRQSTSKRETDELTPSNTLSLKDQLEKQIKSQLGIHKQFLGIKTTQTEGVYRGTLDTPHGKFAIIDRGASIAALRVSQVPQLQIGASVAAQIGKNGMAEIAIELGLSR